MNKSAWTITKLNFKNIKASYIITGILFFALLIQDIVKIIITLNGNDIGNQVSISLGQYPWLLILLAAIFIPINNFRKIINLGGKRIHFFTGSFITYIILAAVVSFVGVVIFCIYDNFVLNTGTFGGIINLIEVWGWSANGMIVAFFRQFAFLLLVAAVTHTLTMIQGSWMGYAVDILLAAFLAVFIPIAPLRAVFVGFFRIIIFQPSAILQIVSCLILAIIIYAVSYPVLCRKKI